MDEENLVKMANQIGAFFETMPNRKQAIDDLAAHFRRFWDPRMRRALFQYVDEHITDSDLNALVLQALDLHRTTML